MTYKKKLIEVALPLEAINREAIHRKQKAPSGFPTMIHKWWAQRPIATCRAVVWASLVDDPSSVPEQFPTEEAQNRERERLFRILERLVLWDNSNNEEVLAVARAEIMKSTGGKPPLVLDPFCGGGSIPLEAQRLGLEAHASDLNPVAVLITKAMIEIPPKFANMPPINSEDRARGMGAKWKRAAGLAADVRYYARWMRDEAERRIGHLYPKMKLPPEHGGDEAIVIAWLWARTVVCPNPACGAQMPLVRSFWLSTKPGKKSWVEPRIDREARLVRFDVHTGNGVPPEPPKVGRGAQFACLVCQQVADDAHLKAEGRDGRLGAQLMAVVAERRRERIYLSPTPDQEHAAHAAQPIEPPTDPLPYEPRAIWCVGYGLDTFDKLFTARQLSALTNFADLVGCAREKVRQDAAAAGLPDDEMSLADGGRGVTSYADAVAVYLGFALSRTADYGSSIAIWRTKDSAMRSSLAQQAIPMTWDFAEGNPFGSSSSGFIEAAEVVARCVESLPANRDASVLQRDATAVRESARLVCTDPPYYDNVGYADLSDFFYVWLRRTLGPVFPDLFGTVLTPKADELIASPYRHDGNKQARAFFEAGLRSAFTQVREAQIPEYPATVFYAFKQSESDSGGSDGRATATASTGWETMLEGLIGAGFMITGTWPVRTELVTALKARVGALASSIVLVCRPRPEHAELTTRRQLVATLRRELTDALRKLQQGSIAPVDLAQAAIGPGMAVYSRYAKVLEPDGSRLTVRTALQLINQALDEVLTEQEGEYDNETRWAIAWFEQFSIEDGPFGQANVLSQAKNTAVNALVEAGVIRAHAGKVRLLTRDELPENWDPVTDKKLTVWELTQHLIRALDKQGEEPAARLIARAGDLAETARDLAYRLYATCERKKWAQEALAYNSLVVAWPEISRLATPVASTTPLQDRLL